MGMPSKFKGFINDREWNRLALHQLRPDFRNAVLEAMAAGFDALDQRQPSDASIDHILDLAQTDADAMRQLSRVDMSKMSEEEVRGSFGMAEFIMGREGSDDKAVQSEMDGEAKERETAETKKKEERAAKKAEREQRKAERAEEDKNRSPYGGMYQ